MKDLFRFSVAYWHTFRGTGSDPFGPGTAQRPWEDGTNGVEMDLKRTDVAFEFMQKLGAPVLLLPRPRRQRRRGDPGGDQRPVRHRRRQAERKTGGDRHRPAVGHREPVQPPAVYARRRHQPARRRVRPRRGAGEKGDGGHPSAGRGRLHLLGRPGGLLQPVQHRYEAGAASPRRTSCTWRSTTPTEIGFTGQFLFEPKPKEPTKHQYDFDVAACMNFLRVSGLEDKVKMNVEANHATSPGTFDDARIGIRPHSKRAGQRRRQHRRRAAGLGHRPVPHGLLPLHHADACW